MPTMQCPTCGVRFDSSQSRSLPFCSQRCRQIDLGRWLGERFGLPNLPDPEDDEAPPANGHPPDSE